MTPPNTYDYVPMDYYAPYYNIATAVIEDAYQDTKRNLIKRNYNERKLAELYAFYTQGLFDLFARNLCKFDEHLERRGIRKEEIEFMKECFEKYECKKKNVKDGNIIKFKPTDNFYIKSNDYLAEVDLKSRTKFINLEHQINAYGTAIYRSNGECIWQTYTQDYVKTYTSQINSNAIKNGYMFAIRNIDDTESVWTKQGKNAYIVKIKRCFLFDTINDEDIEEIFTNGVKYSI